MKLQDRRFERTVSPTGLLPVVGHGRSLGWEGSTAWLSRSPVFVIAGVVSAAPPRELLADPQAVRAHL